MRKVPCQPAAPFDLRRPLERLERLPLRAETALFALDAADDTDPTWPGPALTPRPGRSPTDLDPGWVLAWHLREPGDPALGVVASTPWWPGLSRAACDALERLWRHSVAVALAAERIARESQRADHAELSAAGLLHAMGLWAAAAVAPDWLARWMDLGGREARTAFERATLGADAPSVARRLASRWGVGDEVLDAATTGLDHDAGAAWLARDVERMRVLQAAWGLAEQTPWALEPRPFTPSGGTDPPVKILTAEVQSRCPGAFTPLDPSPREQKLAREAARLRLEVARLNLAVAARDSVLDALAESDAEADPRTWAERAGRAWCALPGVVAARVDWVGSGVGTPVDGTTAPEDRSSPERPPTEVLRIRHGRRPLATVALWVQGDGRKALDLPRSWGGAWAAWAALLDARERLGKDLDAARGLIRQISRSGDAQAHRDRLDALAEFAAGAGHELNNPLAVIVGRAQLLLTRENDPRAVRSLRAILTQAQRAHRILRDLMYVARPPEPRPRFCHPDDVWRASLRDARPEAEERGVGLGPAALDHPGSAWADPDGLRHLADTLLRNAIEATPPGGVVRVASARQSRGLTWTVHDTGRGLSPREKAHLFDPFFCGRDAGRGLGLGLPRASRFVGLLGGEIHVQSAPGQGASVEVVLPLGDPPAPPASAEAPPRGAPALPEKRTAMPSV